MERQGFTFCVCPDSRLMRNHIDALLTSCPPSSGGMMGDEVAWDRQAYWGDEALPPIFWEKLTLQGLFATPNALVVRNAQNIPADTWKRLSAALATPNELAWPIFCLEVGLERGKYKIPAHIQKLKCLSFADKKGWVWRSAGLDAKGMRTFIQNACRERGLQLAPQALEALAAVMPEDATAASNEIDKLALACGEGKTVTKDMAALINHTPNLDIFAFIKALQSGNAPVVWREVLREKGSGDSLAFPFLGMLIREARLLWQLLVGEEVRLPPYILAEKKGMAQQLGHVALAQIWNIALEAERGIKTGERNVDQAMDAMVANLSSLFANRAKAKRRA